MGKRSRQSRWGPVGRALLVLACIWPLARAAAGQDSDSRASGSHAAGEGASRPPQGPFVPEGTDLHSRVTWLIGPAIELRLAEDTTENREDELLYGLDWGFRWKLLEVTTRWAVSPDRENNLEDLRLFAGLTLRGVIPAGPVELLYGAGTHIEARLEDHFFLAYVAPVEVGVVFWDRLSWNMRALGGSRVLYADGPIENVVLDPNGLDEDAQADLEAIRERRLEFYVSLVFARELR